MRECSHSLKREARRNLELIWLLRGPVPGYRTIANFRKENGAALKAANRDFVFLARALHLLGGELVAIDSAFFRGDASKASITTQRKLAERLRALECDIEAYANALEANDAAEAAQMPSSIDCKDIRGLPTPEKLAALMARRTRTKADLDRLEENGELQLSRTVADARLLTKGGHTVAGYNVQLAVDEKHKLIVASEVVNDGNDSGQLYAMAAAAKAALGVATLTAVADAGYYNGETLKACEADAVTAYVPPAERNQRLAAQGRFGRGEFHYDADTDAYLCPAGERLKPMNGRKQDAAGKLQIRYAARVAACGSCSLRAACLTEKAKLRIVYRWGGGRCRAASGPDARCRRNDATPFRRVEHPFGTLKCRAGYRQFLLRGFDKVRGECSLMVLSYNFTRILSIFGIQGFIASLAK
ncbi:transposase [Bradyrhizobium sp. CW7]|uniref:transposase n=1 Tax=Bradyrhizobium sp. CW7 TaxID=2782688 RepID=UPI001FFA21C1|nr:transposase [Bradyrhizobium sp. CW7]MCK1353270.1 transposase [Bradyrhizobium sp. CW7]